MHHIDKVCSTGGTGTGAGTGVCGHNSIVVAPMMKATVSVKSKMAEEENEACSICMQGIDEAHNSHAGPIRQRVGPETATGSEIFAYGNCVEHKCDTGFTRRGSRRLRTGWDVKRRSLE